ncbi:vacuolar protein sorting-associated protein 35 [Auriculariales sp. MPI-PUGE-AT-0066]|nr:vacuolar protein sorting-associated protein 35 [Auriculariales sp. MPI-PUGE-AT-0066]
MAGLPGEEAKLLGEALNTVKIQVIQMKRYLESDQLMDALKAASTMLAELRTSSLSPKQYYELYMAVFDALRHISNYLYDAHTQSRHHLADLYELVQYAGNIVPRLYLMITVGAVYMSIPDAPVKEIMKDMMEMSRGVQHPTRGLFLRHYLSGQTRDHLPVGDDPDSISFVLTNFIEMNKLWVRLQHQGHSRDREKREMERRELRILVGTNLVRLSSLEGVDFDMYQRDILPAILEQVVNCKDVIAQEYLMEVVIQVFPDEFHLHSLGPFLSATAQLQPKVNIKQIVIALVDRLAAYAAREAESEDPDVTKAQEEAAAKRLAERVKQQREARAFHNDHYDQNSIADGYSAEGGFSSTESFSTDATVTGYSTDATAVQGSSADAATATSANKGKGKDSENAPPPPIKKFRGIPDDVKLFEVFWQQIVELIKARPDLALQDITALLVSLCNLGLSCYPDRLEYVDMVFEFAATKTKELVENSDLHSQQTTTNFAALLLAPIHSYTSVLTLLALQQYRSLLAVQPFSTRRSIAHSIVGSVLKNDTVIENPEDVDAILELCQVLIKEQRDATTGLGAVTHGYAKDPRRQQYPEQDDLAEEQGWLAKMVHLFRSDSLDVQFELLKAARKQFESGGDRMRFTFPALISACFKLARRYKRAESAAAAAATAEAPVEPSPEWHTKVSAILKFARQMLFTLSTQVEAYAPALRLFLLAAQISDECGFEDLTYDFYVQAFSVYEESISDSRAQLQAIALIIGTLQGARVFSMENYDTLIQKAAVHSSKLLKKPHQAMAVHLASHLWWQTAGPDEVVTEPDPKADAAEVKSHPHKDSKRILECLQKSLRIASSAIEEIVTVQLYIDALDQYLYYMDRDAPAVTPKFVNSLVELITSSIDSINSTDFHPASRAPPGLVEGVQTPDMIMRHFRNTLYHIQAKKAALAADAPPPTGERPNPKWNEVDVVGACLKMNIGATNVNGHHA